MIICTMTTASHLHRAKTLAESAKRAHPNARFVLCYLESRVNKEVMRFPSFDQVIPLKTLGVPDLHRYLFMRRVNEAAFALKGYFLRYLFNTYTDEQKILFLDTDTLVLSPMTEAEEALNLHPIVLTPHEQHDAKVSYLLHGIINIGFIGLRRGEETFRFLDWWIRRVDRYGFSENYKDGLFYEQNWLNLALPFFDTFVLTHPGYNVAYWNLHERGRTIARNRDGYFVEGVPMRFFHFSHVSDDLKRSMDIHIKNSANAMYRLRNRYLRDLVRMGKGKIAGSRWSYDRYARGERISNEARTLYRKDPELQKSYPDPFAASNRALLRKRCLKIVQVVSNAPAARTLPPFNQGGTEKVVHELTEALVRRGHEVYLYAAAGSRSSAHLHPFPPGLPEKEISGFVRRTMPAGVNVIHDHTFSSAIGRKKWRIPTVCTHHIPVNNRVTHPIYVSQRALKVIGKDRGHYIYNGLNPDDYTFSQEKRGYLLFMGRIVRHKGVHHAIEAAEAAGKPLMIAGPINDRSYFQQEIEPRIRANPDIKYVGAVGGEEKQELLMHAECLLFPSTWEEPFGLVLIEAMACGTPVLALRRGAALELLAGFPQLVCNTVEEMAKKAAEGSYPPAEELRTYVLSRFTSNLMTDAYLARYAQVIQEQRKPSRKKAAKTRMARNVRKVRLISKKRKSTGKAAEMKRGIRKTVRKKTLRAGHPLSRKTPAVKRMQKSA